MIEMRWYVERWEEYRDGLNTGITHVEPPVLQYRYQEADYGGMNEYPDFVWSDWIDVPTVEEE